MPKRKPITKTTLVKVAADAVAGLSKRALMAKYPAVSAFSRVDGGTTPFSMANSARLDAECSRDRQALARQKCKHPPLE